MATFVKVCTNVAAAAAARRTADLFYFFSFPPLPQTERKSATERSSMSQTVSNLSVLETQFEQFRDSPHARTLIPLKTTRLVCRAVKNYYVHIN